MRRGGEGAENRTDKREKRERVRECENNLEERSDEGRCSLFFQAKDGERDRARFRGLRGR